MRDRGDAVDHAGGGERAQRVEPLVRQRDGASAEAASAAPATPDREPDGHLERRTRARRSRTTRRRGVASSIMPIISAIPTGSLAPDSPSRIVPLRPPTSRLPSTENMTAGSVGASAAPRMPAVVQQKPKSACAATRDQRARSRTCRAMPSTAIGDARRAEAPPADVHAAVEEDDDQRDDADPLDLLDRQRVGERREEVRRDGRGEQEERRRRDREVRGQLARDDRQRDAAGDDQDDRPEGADLVHPVSLWPGAAASLRLSYILLIGGTPAGAILRRCDRAFFLPACDRPRFACHGGVGRRDGAPLSRAGEDDGTLSLRDGRGSFALLAMTGSVLGRIDKGTLTITDPDPLDAATRSCAATSGSRSRSANTVQYGGKKPIRFRILGGRFDLTDRRRDRSRAQRRRPRPRDAGRRRLRRARPLRRRVLAQRLPLRDRAEHPHLADRQGAAARPPPPPRQAALTTRSGMLTRR